MFHFIKYDELGRKAYIKYLYVCKNRASAVPYDVEHISHGPPKHRLRPVMNADLNRNIFLVRTITSAIIAEYAIMNRHFEDDDAVSA